MSLVFNLSFFNKGQSYTIGFKYVLNHCAEKIIKNKVAD